MTRPWRTSLTAMPRPRGGGRGLTLVELLLAVGLLAVLISIAVPAYSAWQQKGRITTATRDIAMIDARIRVFELDARAFPASLADVGLGDLLDPWGRPYQYLNLQTLRGNGAARKNRSQVPINSDFDLYSMGPDGRSVGPLTAAASRDDIIRANDGRYIGPAADY